VQLLRVLIAVALLAGSGLIHGAWTQRWHTTPALIEAASVVNRLPMNVGTWQGVNVSPAASEAEQVVHRRYENGQQRVQVVLECGRTGRLASFSPTAFFTDYEIDGEPQTRSVSVNGRGAEARYVKLRPVSKAGPSLLVFCTWKQQGAWEAPENLKWRYRGQPYLYRCYLAYELPQADPVANASNSELLAEWLATLDQCLGVRTNGVEKSE